jgi:hypothetical protein
MGREGAFRQESRWASSQIRPFPALHQKSRASEMLKERPFGGPPSWNAQCKVLKSRALPRWPKHTASWSLGLQGAVRLPLAEDLFWVRLTMAVKPRKAAKLF